MKYKQSREQSGELLRAAIALMGQHDAALNPISFAVWYEHAAGINTRLSRAIAECLRSEPRLGDATVDRLYREHVSGPDEEAVRAASGRLESVMGGLAQGATHAGAEAERFDQTLAGLETALVATAGAAVAPLVGNVRAGTAQMRRSATALRDQLDAGRSEIVRLRAELVRAHDEARLDPLTRVLNRKGFDQRLEAMLVQGRERGGSHTLVMFDIDRFKNVNDTYGHVMGDRVLQAVAEVLQASASHPELAIARYGGEEFAWLLPSTGLQQAFEMADAARSRVKALKVRDRRTHGVILTVTISAGVAAAQPADDASGLIARADAALYAAKQAGRDQVRCAEPPSAAG